VHHRPVRRVALLAVSVVLVGCNGGTVDRHALSKDGDAVASLACEGRLLARDVAQDDSTTRFTRVHAGELQQHASNFEDALSERPTAPEIEDDVRALARKAGDVADLLARLHRSPGDGDLARQLEPLLQKAGDCP
jgi:hypothetical protein